MAPLDGSVACWRVVVVVVEEEEEEEEEEGFFNHCKNDIKEERDFINDLEIVVRR